MRVLNRVIVLALLVSGFGSASAVANHLIPSPIKSLEAKLTSDIASDAIKLPVKPHRIEDYSRFYRLDDQGGAMAIFKLPSSLTPTMAKRFPPGVHTISDLDQIGPGGGCPDTLFITIRSFKDLKYEVFCGAR